MTAAAEDGPELDEINRPIWVRDARGFAADDSWSDPGERNAFLAIADEVRGGRIVDVGMGTGRTTYLLRLLSQNYLGVDYTPEMVHIARELHPGVEFRVGDARDLTDVPDASVDLLVFSLNGIDALDHDDRGLALREFHRVLADGALLLFSTLDKFGYSYRAAPWDAHQHDRHDLIARGVRFGLRIPKRAPHYVRSYRNWNRYRKQAVDHGDWGISQFAAHDFGLITHFITPQAQRRVLGDLGFDVLALYADSGVELTPDSPPGGHTFFHVVARKSASTRS